MKKRQYLMMMKLIQNRENEHCFMEFGNQTWNSIIISFFIRKEGKFIKRSKKIEKINEITGYMVMEFRIFDK